MRRAIDVGWSCEGPARTLYDKNAKLNRSRHYFGAVVLLPWILSGCGSGGERHRNLTLVPTDCVEPAIPIYQVQGVDTVSPLVGEQVTVRGVVVGDFQGRGQLGGFFVQNAGVDDDPRSSEGLFVFAPKGPEVAVGEHLQIRGRVSEHHELTQLTDLESVEICSTLDISPPEPRRLALHDGVDLEAYEGMWVSVDDPLTVVGTHELAQFGQILLAVGGRSFEAGRDGKMSAPGLLMDDGSRRKNLALPPYLDDEGTRRVGDEVRGLTGIVAQTEDGHVLHPTAPPTFERVDPRASSPPAVDGTLRIASFNLLNLFVTLGERGAIDERELERQLAKHVVAITALDADVLALVELENNPAAINTLVATLNDATDRPYAATPPPDKGLGDDVIRVGFLYRPDRVGLVGPSRSDPDPVFRRPPLAQTFAVGDEHLTVVVSHFKSKSCRNVVETEQDQGDGQGCWNPLRIRQAQRLAEFVAELQQVSGDADVLVTGDLNAYGGEDPIRALTNSGLVDQIATHIPAAKRYSYVYKGRSGYLDHALATPSLAPRVRGAAIWHINSDEPTFLDYRIDANPPELYRADPFRSSDHDPVLIGLDF